MVVLVKKITLAWIEAWIKAWIDSFSFPTFVPAVTGPEKTNILLLSFPQIKKPRPGTRRLPAVPPIFIPFSPGDLSARYGSSSFPAPIPRSFNGEQPAWPTETILFQPSTSGAHSADSCGTGLAAFGVYTPQPGSLNRLFQPTSSLHQHFAHSFEMILSQGYGACQQIIAITPSLWKDKNFLAPLDKKSWYLL